MSDSGSLSLQLCSSSPHHFYLSAPSINVDDYTKHSRVLTYFAKFRWFTNEESIDHIVGKRIGWVIEVVKLANPELLLLLF